MLHILDEFFPGAHIALQLVRAANLEVCSEMAALGGLL